MRDVVVVGAGHNALVAACYLARDGLDVEVVERDTVVGGACSTVERWPGYRVDRGSSAHVMVRHTGVVEELDLAAYGLAYQDCDPWGFAPFWTEPAPDGRPGGEQVGLTFWTDVERTCASVAEVCGGADAEAYRRFVDDWGARSARVFEAFAGPPTAGRLGRAFWGVGRGARTTGVAGERRAGGAELTRQALQPGDHLLDAYFTDERLKTALAWMGAQSGPPTHEVTTAPLVGWLPLMHRRPPGHPVGGSGMLSEALARRLAADGGVLRLGDGAARLTRGPSGGVDGVVTESGAHVRARAVLAGCHLFTTAALLGDDAFTSRVRRHARVGDGLGMVVRLATTGLPHYPADPDGHVHRALQLLAPSRAHLRAAYGDFLAGRQPRRPAALTMTFSAFDDTLAPAGRHTVSVWGQWHPYALADGTPWEDAGAEAADRLVAEVDRAAPGFADTVTDTYVQTPADLERELGLPRGNVMHLEMGLDTMFSLRPLPELSAYRTPVAGLYLTGASTHPGGGVSGASGRSAARRVRADLTGRTWRPGRRRGAGTTR